MWIRCITPSCSFFVSKEFLLSKEKRCRFDNFHFPFNNLSPLSRHDWTIHPWFTRAHTNCRPDKYYITSFPFCHTLAAKITISHGMNSRTYETNRARTALLPLEYIPYTLGTPPPMYTLARVGSGARFSFKDRLNKLDFPQFFPYFRHVRASRGAPLFIFTRAPKVRSYILLSRSRRRCCCCCCDVKK